jgi:hypothetical protein
MNTAMNQADEMERTVAFRASAGFPSQARLAAGREHLLAAAMAEQGRAEGAPPAWPRHAGLRAPAGSRRHAVLAASAAAALVLLGGAGYGAAAALTGHAPGTAGTAAKAAVLTSVSGCATLKQVSGTLEQVNGSSLVLKTSSGQSVTVTTSAATRVATVVGQLSDITDGAPVTVTGPGSDGTIAAQVVGLGNPAPPNPQKNAPANGGLVQTHTQTAQGDVTVSGTVSDASATGFTVIESDGAQIPVTTSSDTLVKIRQASLSELQTGATTIAVGYAGPDRTLSAMLIAQPLPGGRFMLSVQGCSSSSIQHAITAALAADD